MNVKQARQLIKWVAEDLSIPAVSMMDLRRMGEEELVRVGASVGLTREDLATNRSPVPDAVRKKYKVFDLMSQWDLAGMLVGKYGPMRFLQRVFRNQYHGPDVPSEEEEREMMARAVLPRCDAKARQINELFPGSFPVELPVLKFMVETSNFRSFKEVYQLADAFDELVECYGKLFFKALEGDLTEKQALEFDLLSSFLEARDVVDVRHRMTYAYVAENRTMLREEGFHQLSSYVGIRRIIPVWKAREFYVDQAYVTRYIERHDVAKVEIRRFLSKIDAFSCCYVFIQNMEEHELLQSLPEEERMERETANMLQEEMDESNATYLISDPILVTKVGDEVSEKDLIIAERGLKMVKSVRNGGVLPRRRQESYDILRRQMKRFGMEIPEQPDVPLPDELADFMLDEEEGDWDE